MVLGCTVLVRALRSIVCSAASLGTLRGGQNIREHLSFSNRSDIFTYVWTTELLVYVSRVYCMYNVGA